MPVLTRSQTRLAAAAQDHNQPTRAHHEIHRSGVTPVPEPPPEFFPGPKTKAYLAYIFSDTEENTEEESSPPPPTISRSASPVHIKSERTPSPELGPARKKQALRKSNRIERLRKRTPPRELFRRTPSPYPHGQKVAARGHRTAKLLTPPPSLLPVQQPGRRRPKIFLRLQRPNVDAEFHFVPRPPILIPLHRPDAQADWEYNRNRV